MGSHIKLGSMWEITNVLSVKYLTLTRELLIARMLIAFAMRTFSALGGDIVPQWMPINKLEMSKTSSPYIHVLEKSEHEVQS
jgi:hypothetical protein